MKTSTFMWIVVVVIVLLGLGWWWYAQPVQTTENPAGTVEEGSTLVPGLADEGQNTGTGESAAPQSAAVTMGTAGFTPANVTIKKGGTVTWSNAAGGGMWVASDEHPTHTEYDGTSRTQHCAQGAAKSFDQCGTGNTYSFTFDKAGMFNYHNHVNAGQEGTVTVVE